MHQASGKANQEVTAFIAACLSYGSREQFVPKIQLLFDCAKGNLYEWVKSGLYSKDIPHDSDDCFYRLYTFRQFNIFLCRLRQMLLEYDSIGQYVRQHCGGDAMSAIETICQWFADTDTNHIVPKDTQSPCKRICLFLRWMVRRNSPVDLGLWADFIDSRTLIMPLDTHVLQQSVRLGLLSGKTATMSTAKKLTDKLSEFFPDDPLKGDFALFGYGVNSAMANRTHAMLLKVINKTFSVCKVTDYSEVDLMSDFVFIGKTDGECSLVCETSKTPSNTTERDDGWRAFRIEGILDFSLIGILAKISTCLAENGVRSRRIQDMLTIDTTNMCSHLQRKLFEEDGIYHHLWIAMQDDPELTAAVRSRQLHIYRNGKKVLVLAGKATPKVIREDKLCEILQKEK